MKKALVSLAASLLVMGLSAGAVSADSTTTTNNTNSSTSSATDCTIYESGSESYNSCESNSSQNAQAICQNNTYVLNNNSQNAGTGGVTVTSNGSGGSAVSGTATNQNNNTVTIGSSCETTPVATTTTTPTVNTTTTVTPATATPAANPQVVAPVGAVEAGDGGGAKVSSLSIAGLGASSLIVGLGGVLLRRRLLSRS